MSPRPKSASAGLPRVNGFLLALFRRYARRYIRRHFHAVRLSRGGKLPELPEGPLVIYMNHPSWWDPMIALLFGTIFFSDRRQYAPIDKASLERYRFFGRLGFFGIELNSFRGAKVFLSTAARIFEEPDSVLWITPEGRFTDPRVRPIRFQPGLSAAAALMETGALLPMAVEYPFWEERLPEVLVRFGPPVRPADIAGRDRAAINGLLEAHLRAAQDALAGEAIAADPQAFEVMLSGRTGVGAVYDAWRRLGAVFRGKPFEKSHGVG